jgi:opacity protein-like surface antigen
LLDGFESKLVDRDNNGVVTADELYSYLAPKVFELSRSEGGQAHRPVFANLKASDGQFVFLVNVPEYTMTIAGLPVNNRVFIGGKEIAANKDTVVQTLNRGSYLVEVEAPGYERYSTTIDLSSERVLQPHMFTWTEAARRRLLDLENAVRKTRVSVSGGLSFPVSDFGSFVSQSPGYSVIAKYEHDIGSGIALLGGVDYTKWRSHTTPYGTYHPDYTPEFNFDNQASAIAAKAGARAYWDLDMLRLFGLGEIGISFMKYEIQDRDNAVDLRKNDTNLNFAFGIGCSIGVSKRLDLDLTARQVIGQALKLTYKLGEPFQGYEYGAIETKLSYVEIALGFSFTLTNLIAGN